uniref:Mesencephalic astrocyte-derived neurotrophic factor homolog n=1 Tax=Clastoptera arizonana TaxID=38151 RepID=A0A1B6E242_9HEMI
MAYIIFCSIILVCFPVMISSLEREECEVCIAVVEKFAQTLTEEEKSNQRLIEEKFRQFCETAKDKEDRFCYYIGGKADSATGILSDLSWPLKASMPADVICTKLNKKDSQLCALRYDKEIDLNTVDLKKLKVRQLKKILNNWNENCDGCIEKSDFIKRIEELKPLYYKEEL